MRNLRAGTNKVIWHCSATPPSQDIGAKEIDEMHRDQGWNGIGYHLVIRRNGVVNRGEPLANVGAHAKGYNFTSVAVCMIGGIQEGTEDDNRPIAENNFTAEQWSSAKHVFTFLGMNYPNVEHVGHRDLSLDTDNDGRIQKYEFMKECPCYSVKQWVQNGLKPVSGMYAPWELDVEVEVPKVKITFQDLLDDGYEDEYNNEDEVNDDDN